MFTFLRLHQCYWSNITKPGKFCKSKNFLKLKVSDTKHTYIFAALNDDSIAEEGYAYYLQGSVELITWLVHFVYVLTLLERLTPSIRGKRGALCFFVIVAIVDCLRCKTIITKDLTEGKIFCLKVSWFHFKT